MRAIQHIFIALLVLGYTVPCAANELKKQQAVDLYNNQEQKIAFQLFLDALDDLPLSISSQTQTEDESKYYAEALNLYLNQPIKHPQLVAREIEERYVPVLANHPDYHHLGFIVAAAYANSGYFEEFFDLFYRSYAVCPQHYLAYKIKGVLHIKLYEKCPIGPEQEQQREYIQENLKRAMEIYPDDTTLYKLSLTFAKKENNRQFVSVLLNKILDKNMIVPRTDIGFYIEHAVEADQLELAQRFIDAARNWYKYSRVVNEAQAYLDQHKKR